MGYNKSLYFNNSSAIINIEDVVAMGDKPILTIAVPTYNGSKTIRNMLDILLPQCTEEVEVLVSDNCSTDNTSKFIKDYQKEYPNIRYIRNEKNLGADGNFLQCMKLADGKFTMLVSDDDIICEGAVEKILSFLKQYPRVSLAYLDTVGFHDHYINVKSCKVFKIWSKEIEASLVTTDKKEFFEYVGRQWGFTSSFLWNTERFKAIKSPEIFFNTYWLQSYIHILCSNKSDDLLGVIKGPCCAAGGYGIIGNYDAAEIEAVRYKKMLDYAVDQAGYDKKQLEAEWLWKTCYLTSRAVIKERSIGVHKTSEKTLFSVLWKYPYAWVHLFPFLLAPRPLCKLVLKKVRQKQGRNYISYVNRPTENNSNFG